MSNIRLEQLGIVVKNKRGNRGLREIAKKMGISHTTLARVEAGKQPDLDTFSKICKWLEINPSDVLNLNTSNTSNSNSSSEDPSPSTFSVQFRADRTFSPETAKRIGEMIIAVQKMVNNEQAT